MRDRAPTSAPAALATALTLAIALLATATSSPAESAPAPNRSITAPDFVAGEVVVRLEGQRFGTTLELPDSISVGEATRALAASPGVRYATPNYIATASALPPFPVFPRDPGVAPGRQGKPGGWVRKQWNFLPCGSLCDPDETAAPFQSAGGINAVDAWANLIAAGRPGASLVKIAVLDTGVAYRRLGSIFRRSPDFIPSQFVAGYDFVQDDAIPLDHNGHGTHTAGTIGERTNNAVGVTGLAYGARLMPVRVLNGAGRGSADDIAKGIRFAANHGAQVINMSFNFECGQQVPIVAEAIRVALNRGAVVVAAVGNWDGSGGRADPRDCIEMPAMTQGVIAVGGSTAGGCVGAYSRVGPRVDLVAPGGGVPDRECLSLVSRPILQVTFNAADPAKFGLPRHYEGTSMAAAHVSGVAAMVIASGLLGPRPTPAALAQHLRDSARDIGPPGRDPSSGAGILDAAAATATQR